MPRVGNRDRGPMQALRRLVDITTLISPTEGGFHRPAIVTFEKMDSSTGTLVMTPVMERHFRNLYDELRGRDSLLSQAKLAAFLRDIQQDSLKPLEKGRYRFEEFLEVWWHHYGMDAMKPVNGEKDLSKPISNYFISSSHNTYLDGDQYFSNSCADMYRKVLENDCRCIEIDVWNGDMSGSRTPNRSRSPNPEHRRHLSTSTVATSVLEAMEEKLETVRHIMSGKDSHSRSNSSSQNALAPNPGPRDSRVSLDPSVLAEKLERPASSRSRSSYPKHEPLVMHATPFLGKQATVNRSVVGFREVCKTIKESAFAKNPLPIIVSLEVHASPEQQEVMVEIMKEEWAGLLLDEPIEGCDPRFRQPRLDELLNKILIKVRKAAVNSTNSTLAALVTPHEDDGHCSDDEASTAKKVRICENLGKLAIYSHGARFKSFDAVESKTPGHIFSIAETRILNLHTNKATHTGLLTHNRSHLMRAYPDPTTHVLSTNLDPSLFWRKGVQMVALNWQTLDEGMMLNTGMFDNQRGWVLKPPGYRSSDLSSTSQAEALPHKSLTLSITILAGQHLPLPKVRQNNSHHALISGVGANSIEKSFHPCVKCELHVEKPEERTGDAIEGGGRVREGQHKQKTTSRKTEHPDFGTKGVTIHFERIEKVVEELSFVRFKIEDENKPLASGSLSSSHFFAGWACIRLDRLQQGYRFIRILDAKGHSSDGKLLVKIEKTFH